MDVFEAIHNRQSIGKMRQDPVPRELIEKILEAAVQAPNHYSTRPWRWVVMMGEARKQLGDVMAASIKGDAASKPEALEAERAKPLRAPVVIAVGVDKPMESKVKDIENICAAAAAAQNLLLAATALGLASIWRTGGAVDDPNIKIFLGFAPDQHLLGFIYVGYPANPTNERNRPSFEDRTLWME